MQSRYNFPKTSHMYIQLHLEILFILACFIPPDMGKDRWWFPQRPLLLWCLWTHCVDSQSAERQRCFVDICRLDSAQKPRGVCSFFSCSQLNCSGQSCAIKQCVTDINTLQKAFHYIDSITKLPIIVFLYLKKIGVQIFTKRPPDDHFVMQDVIDLLEKYPLALLLYLEFLIHDMNSEVGTAVT